MSKYSRAGGKFSGNHTTLIPAACILADIASACDETTNISPGFIKSGLKPTSGHRKVKITDEGGAILLSVRDIISHQEVHVFTHDPQKTRTAIARGARNAGFSISFGKHA